MKLRVLTTAGDELLYEDVRSGGWIEFKLDSGDPDLPTKFWLDDVAEVSVEGQPVPIAQHTQAPPLVEAEFDVSIYTATGERVGEKRTVKRLVSPAQAAEWKDLRQPWPGVIGAPRLPGAKAKTTTTGKRS